jgi:hypothetical protein
MWNYTGCGTVWHIVRLHWSWYRRTHCQVKGTGRGTIWHIARCEALVEVPYDTLLGAWHYSWYRMPHFNPWPRWKRKQNLHKFRNYNSIRQHLWIISIGNARLLTSMWLITLLGQTWHCCSLCGLLQRFCSIVCWSIIKMATISRGYVNLLPAWYFKIALSYIIHVLVFYQGDAFVCRFEIVTNQGPIKLKQVITWRCIQ